MLAAAEKQLVVGLMEKQGLDRAVAVQGQGAEQEKQAELLAGIDGGQR
jgi:hypothetical protein